MFVVLFVGVYVCADPCAHRWNFMFRPEVNTACLPQLLSTLCFEAGSLAESGALPFSQTADQQASRQTPISTSLALRVQAFLHGSSMYACTPKEDTSSLYRWL